MPVSDDDIPEITADMSRIEQRTIAKGEVSRVEETLKTYQLLVASDLIKTHEMKQKQLKNLMHSEERLAKLEMRMEGWLDADEDAEDAESQANNRGKKKRSSRGAKIKIMKAIFEMRQKIASATNQLAEMNSMPISMPGIQKNVQNNYFSEGAAPPNPKDDFAGFKKS